MPVLTKMLWNLNYGTHKKTEKWYFDEKMVKIHIEIPQFGNDNHFNLLIKSKPPSPKTFCGR